MSLPLPPPVAAAARAPTAAPAQAPAPAPAPAPPPAAAPMAPVSLSTSACFAPDTGKPLSLNRSFNCSTVSSEGVEVGVEVVGVEAFFARSKRDFFFSISTPAPTLSSVLRRGLKILGRVRRPLAKRPCMGARRAEVTASAMNSCKTRIFVEG
ncbi:hypothetical protein B484DRAFT_458935 [Ochromonadaceae sp. CCMP2298]|nr:hypothetical protein B484DRAFT_458935 [Ochromonadaceae sp. CCMP2298]